MPPNIILVFVDNQPAELLGCYGNAEIHTPHLDRMAADGLRFNEAYCPNAMCSPCRASVLTGLMPSQHGVHTWLDDSVMDRWPEGWSAIDEFVTLPEILRDAGYRTALIGKYHIGSPEKPQNGFEHWVSLNIGHTLSFYGNTVIDNRGTFVVPEHSVDYFTERAVDYIEAHDAEAGRPFFMFLTYNAPYGHWPSIKGPAGNRFARLYETTPMHSVPREGLNEKVIDWVLINLRQEGANQDLGYPQPLLQQPNDLESLRNYFSQMSMVDDGVGQVLETLDRKGLAEETLVIYTADHGFSLGHHGVWGHGEDSWPSNCYGVSYSIPLILRHNGRIAPGQVSDRLVGTTDLFETILHYLDLESAPRNAAAPARSFAPLLRGETLEWEDVVFMEQEETRAIRTAEWLYMTRFQCDRYPFEDELYDLERDPGEYRNLAGDPAHTATVAHLRERLESFFARNSDPRYDLWRGGRVKSNSTRPWLWQEIWGDDWRPVY